MPNRMLTLLIFLTAMNKRPRRLIPLALSSLIPATAYAGYSDNYVANISTAGPTYVDHSVSNFAWDGNHASKNVPNVFGGTGKFLGWLGPSRWFQVHVASSGNYALRLARISPFKPNSNPAFTLWPVGANPFDFDTAIHCGNFCGASLIGFPHSYNQVAPPSPTNASAWMLGNAGKTPGGGSLDWTPQPGKGVVTGFVGYANSGPGGWLNGMPINTDKASPDYNLSQDQNPVLQGGDLSQSTLPLGPDSNACAPLGGGAAGLNLYNLPAGYYLLAAGGSCHGGYIADPSCPTGDALYRLEIIPITRDGPVALATASTTKVRAGGEVVLDAGHSFDPKTCQPLSTEWTQRDTSGFTAPLSDPSQPRQTFKVPLSAARQTLAFDLKVASSGLSDAATATVDVTDDNQPPAIEIMAVRATEASPGKLTATITDPDGDGIAHYHWEQIDGPPATLTQTDGPILSFIAPSLSASVAELSFRLTVTDDFSPNPRSSSMTAKVTVNNDYERLDCDFARAEPASLPNHKRLVPVAITHVTTPNLLTRIEITDVTSDEPVKDPAAADRTGPDAKIQHRKLTKKQPWAFDTVQLRGEAQAKRPNGTGSGNGRVYEVKFTASDGGRTCAGAVKVPVAVSGEETAVDDGQRFDATRLK